MQKSSQNVFSSFFSSSSSKSRPGTSSGESAAQQQQQQFLLQQQQQQQQSYFLAQQQPNVLTKDRKPNFARKASFTSPSKKRSGSSGSAGSFGSGGGSIIVTDKSAPPALPDFAIPNAAKLSRETDAIIASPASADSFSRMLGRTAPTPTGYNNNSSSTGGGGGGGLTPATAALYPAEASGVHGNIQEIAKKRINSLDYLRKAHEGQVFWFNTYMLEKPEQTRMSAVAAQKMARRATNYLLLGLSLPTIMDLYSSTPLEYIRSLNTLLSEFESFQQLHGESGSTGSLSRARLPQMFRRGPGGKSRRSNGQSNDNGYPTDSDGGIGGLGMAASASVVSFAATDSDLLPGETYTYLLTPSLPFDPDFHETFATLCDVLIDSYKRALSLLPTPRECTAPVAEQFAKVDSKVRKIIMQGTIKDFEETSRTHIKTELANISKVVLSGLM